MRVHAVLLASLLLILACGPSLAERDQEATEPTEAAQGEIEFTFSADPSDVVLFVRYRGGMSRGPFFYTLYGDGRLEMIRRTDEREVHLDFAQMQEFVRIPVTRGLLETNEQELETRMRMASGGRIPPPATDSGHMLVQINLKTYVRGGTPGRLSSSFELQSPRTYHTAFPDIEEIEALVLLMEQLSDYWHAAATVQEGSRHE